MTKTWKYSSTGSRSASGKDISPITRSTGWRGRGPGAPSRNESLGRALPPDRRRAVPRRASGRPRIAAAAPPHDRRDHGGTGAGAASGASPPRPVAPRVAQSERRVGVRLGSQDAGEEGWQGPAVTGRIVVPFCPESLLSGVYDEDLHRLLVRPHVRCPRGAARRGSCCTSERSITGLRSG